MKSDHAALILLTFLTLSNCSPRHSAGTACADEDGEILGEVSCAGASKVMLTKESAVAEVTTDDAGEFIEACQKIYKDRLAQVGKKLFECDMNFVPYTVVSGTSRVKLNSESALEQFKKPKPVPRVQRKSNSGIATQASIGFAAVMIIVGIFI